MYLKSSLSWVNSSVARGKKKSKSTERKRAALGALKRRNVKFDVEGKRGGYAGVVLACLAVAGGKGFFIPPQENIGAREESARSRKKGNLSVGGREKNALNRGPKRCTKGKKEKWTSQKKAHI